MIRNLATVLGRQSIAILALVVAVSGGTAYAASALFTGANIVDGSLTGSDVGNGTLTGADIANGSITSADLSSSATGGGAAPLAEFTVSAPSTFSGSAGRAVLASQTISLTAGTFVDGYTFGALEASADYCTGGEFSTQVGIAIDGTLLQASTVSFFGVETFTTNPTNANITWLEAGSHVVELVVDPSYCSATAAGDLTVTSFHALLKAA